MESEWVPSPFHPKSLESADEYRKTTPNLQCEWKTARVYLADLLGAPPKQILWGYVLRVRYL